MDIAGIDMTVPSFARVYDYLTGGTDNYEVDRVAARTILDQYPDAAAGARVNREWIGRIVRTAISEGVTQFVDIGSGLPTADNVHQVAQRYAPEALVAYSDNDPIVLAHGRHLLVDNSQTRYVQADARDPEAVLSDAAQLIDFSRPVAVILAAILHFVPDVDDPAGIVRRYAAALPPGSLVAISHATSDDTDKELLELIEDTYKGTLLPRSAAAIARLFGDKELLEPGLVDQRLWRPDHAEQAASLRLLGGLAKI